MKITDLTVYLVDPGAPGRRRAWVFLRIDTDEGISGYGEASNYPDIPSLAVGHTLELLKEKLVGEDPNNIERIWQKVYRPFTHVGSRGIPTAAASGIDIALWDLKGKALGRPVYDLLGGAMRDSIQLYANAWYGGCETPEDYALAAKAMVNRGYSVLKIDPFHHEMARYDSGLVDTPPVPGGISLRGEQKGVDIVAAVREGVGPHIELLIDVHGHYNVPTAIRLANHLAEYDIAWFEEPVPPESYAALQQVRQSVSVPISVGERLTTRFDFVPIFEGRLADYVEPDVLCVGGISELRKVAIMAEAYYIPVAPHDALGSLLQIVAGAHAMMATPNFYTLEYCVSNAANKQRVIGAVDIRDGHLHLSGRPGLGVEVDEEFLLSRPVLR